MGHADDLSHLTPVAREIATLPNAERIRRMRGDRWIGYPRAVDAIAKLNELLSWPVKQRMPNVLIFGPTNNGKSMVIGKFRRDHAPPACSADDAEQYPVLAIEMPSDPSVTRFYAYLLHKIGAPIRPRMRISDLEPLALQLLRTVGLRMLIIDELHNILAGPTKQQREFLNLLRFLGNELRVPIVGLGTRDAFLAIRSDPQLENRFEPFPLPRWQEGEELKSLLASFAATYPLRAPSILGTDEIARYVLARSEGTIGEIATLLREAAIKAIESGQESINSKVLASLNYGSPSDRRRQFEREVA